MKDLAPFLVVGLATGSLYGLAGTGLVLTYKTSGVFNFAHGAVAATAAYAFYDLHYLHGLPWVVTLLLCVGVLAPALGLVIERIARALSGTRPVYAILATVGLLLALQGYLTWKYGAARNFPEFLPQKSFTVAGVNVRLSQIVTMLVGLAGAAGLYVFFTTRRIGVAMRAVVDDPALLGLTGTSPVMIRRVAWMIGTSFAALSGILVAPTLQLDAILLTLLVVQAFGATAVGGFSSLPLTYVGGLVIGVATALATKYVGSNPALAGLPSSVPFIVLFITLLVRPKRLFQPGGGAAVQGMVREGVRRPRLNAAGLVAVGAFAVLVPSLVGQKLPVYTSALIFFVIFMSLALLVWTSGQISLCHAAFAALGATTFSHLTHGAGLPWGLALIGAGLAVVPLGAVLAVPAIRLSGVYLALATFGFGLLLERLIYPTSMMFGKTGLRPAPRPKLGMIDATGDRGFYFLVLAIVVLTALVVATISKTRLGRLLRALGDAPVALSTHGLNINATRVLVFCISAFLAGVGGALYAAQLGFVGPSGLGTFQSLIWLSVLVLGGTALLRAPIIAAGLLVIMPAYLPGSFANAQMMVFGLGALVATVLVLRPHRGLRVDTEALEARRSRSPVQARFEEKGPVQLAGVGGAV